MVHFYGNVFSVVPKSKVNEVAVVLKAIRGGKTAAKPQTKLRRWPVGSKQ